MDVLTIAGSQSNQHANEYCNPKTQNFATRLTNTLQAVNSCLRAKEHYTLDEIGIIKFCPCCALKNDTNDEIRSTLRFWNNYGDAY